MRKILLLLTCVALTLMCASVAFAALPGEAPQPAAVVGDKIILEAGEIDIGGADASVITDAMEATAPKATGAMITTLSSGRLGKIFASAKKADTIDDIGGMGGMVADKYEAKMVAGYTPHTTQMKL